MNETEIGLLSEQEQAVGSREAAEKLGARIDELVAEHERLHRWKREASEVMSKWEAVWEALGRPGKLGRSKAEGALAEVENLRAASARAITLWQAAHPDRADIWPDQAELLVWLLEQLDALRAERDGLEARLRTVDRVMGRADEQDDGMAEW